MPFKANQDRRQHIPKQRHKVTNWAGYDRALRQRGSLTVWFPRSSSMYLTRARRSSFSSLGERAGFEVDHILFNGYYVGSDTGDVTEFGKAVVHLGLKTRQVVFGGHLGLNGTEASLHYLQHL